MKKKEILKTIIVIIVSVVLSSGISVYATSTYLYDSCDVSYDNSSSGLNSSNVQSSLDELYMHATDYTSMDTRVSSLEGHFQNNATSYFDSDNLFIAGNSSTTPDGVWIEFMHNGIDRLGIGVHSSGNTEIATKGSDGTIGGSPLTISASAINLKNNSNTSVVKINGTNISTTTKSGNLTIDTTYTKTSSSSSINYVKIGKLVIVNIYDICPKQNSQASYSIVTGLPEADGLFVNLISNNSNSGTSSGYRLAINNNTNLVWWWVDGSSDCKPSSGQLIYISKS